MFYKKEEISITTISKEKKKQVKKRTTYCVAIAYDGSEFFGWAKQTSLRTVEGEINKILKAIFQIEITIDGSSRTDTGVHAYDQLFTFSLPFLLDEKEMLAILNQHFNRDIKIKNVKIVPNYYDLRKYVEYKEYRYYINTGSHNPFKINYQCQYGKKISVRKLKKALQEFFGSHYFYNFSGMTRSDPKSPYRTITKIKVWKWRKQIVIVVQGKGFLRYQIRYMVAAALDYCEGKVSLEDINQYLSDKETKRYPYAKASASGLYLYKTVVNEDK